MASTEAIEFLVLGPLEVRVDGRSRPVGGAKQRAVLGLLLLHADEVVPVDRIVDEVWGDEPPPSAAHSIESHVSRLRGQIERYGPSIVRQGGGYRLDLDGARLDARTAEELLRSASEASDAGDYERAAELAREALRLWRGPALRDAPLHGAGRAEANELDELRLRVLERLAEAELALGRHQDAISRLRPLVDEHPYRENFVAQLMLALYRAGRPAEALDLYERSRQALAEDLGLRPSAELQRLSGEIVRHDPGLALPVAGADGTGDPRQPARGEAAPDVAAGSRRRAHLSRRNVAALVVLVAAVAAAVVFAIGAGPGDSKPDPGAIEDVLAETRVGLVLPRQPATSDDFYAPYVEGLLQAKRDYGVDTKTVVVDPAAQRLSNRVRNELRDLDLVLLAGPAVHNRFVKEVPRSPDTHFVFLDPSPSWDETQVNEFPNSTDIFFIEGPASYYAGYIGALMEKQRPGRTGPVVVSVVAADEVVGENLVAGFRVGAREAVPGAVVLVNYSRDSRNTSECQKLANQQIDDGSRVVFAAAGTCSLGALSAAAVRGVWSVGVNLDDGYIGSRVLVSVVKRLDRAAVLAIRSYLDGTLESGSLDIGIERDAVGISDVSREVPAEIRRKVAQAVERHMNEWASWSTPQVRQGDG